MTTFWRTVFTGIITIIINKMTISKLEFFQYDLLRNFNLLSLLSFLIDIIIFAAMYMIIYFILYYLSKWKMRLKYELAQKKK